VLNPNSLRYEGWRQSSKLLPLTRGRLGGGSMNLPQFSSKK
jgi:hypothetical protein